MSHGPDDVDPTGVRELLRSLPAPGPMPPDVEARLWAALERERRQPAGLDVGAEELEVALGMAPVSLVDDDPDESRAATGTAAGGPVLAQVAHLRARRRPRWPLVAAAAATVAALAVGGALLVNERRGDRTSASMAKGSSQPTMVAVPSANPSQRVQIRTSTRTYTSADLAQQAQGLLEQSSGGPTGVTDIGPIGTPEGLAECIATLGEDDADTITADVAVFDGQPAVVIVAVKDGVKQVYVVQRDCGKGDPGILQEGTPLN